MFTRVYFARRFYAPRYFPQATAAFLPGGFRPWFVQPQLYLGLKEAT